MKKLVYRLLALSVIATVIATGTYVYKFGSPWRPTLSSDKSEWGLFGDYIGGTLGTYFSFLAFIGVLYTALIQHQQLKHVEAQAHIEEFQRLTATLSARIDDMLAAAPRYPSERITARLGGREMPMSVFKILAACGTIKLSLPHESHQLQDEHNLIIAEGLECLKSEIPVLIIELQQLARCLQLHQAHGGSEGVAVLYRERYQTIVCWLDALGFQNSARVNEYFRPKDIVEFLKPQPVGGGPPRP